MASLIKVLFDIRMECSVKRTGSNSRIYRMVLDRPDEIERINLAKKDAGSPIEPKPVVVASAESGTQNAGGATPVVVANEQKTASSASKTVSSGPAYYLQLGAYQQASNAQSYQAKFSLDWAHKLPSLEVVQTGDYYKLFAGPFNTLAEATQVVEEMKSMGTNSFVVRR